MGLAVENRVSCCGTPLIPSTLNVMKLAGEINLSCTNPSYLGILYESNIPNTDIKKSPYVKAIYLARLSAT